MISIGVRGDIKTPLSFPPAPKASASGRRRPLVQTALACTTISCKPSSNLLHSQWRVSFLQYRFIKHVLCHLIKRSRVHAGASSLISWSPTGVTAYKITHAMDDTILPMRRPFRKTLKDKPSEDRSHMRVMSPSRTRSIGRTHLPTVGTPSLLPTALAIGLLFRHSHSPYKRLDVVVRGINAPPWLAVPLTGWNKAETLTSPTPLPLLALASLGHRKSTAGGLRPGRRGGRGALSQWERVRLRHSPLILRLSYTGYNKRIAPYV